MTETEKHAVINTDGGSRGNPGPAACAWSITLDNIEIADGGQYLGKATNNTAEYTGVINGLKNALDLNIESVTVLSDSQLVVNQMNREWKVKNPNVKKLWTQAQGIAQRFRKTEFKYVPREKNQRPDQILNKVLNQAKKNGYPETPEDVKPEPTLFD